MAAQRSKGTVLSFRWVLAQGHIQMTAQPPGAALADQRAGKGSCDLGTTAGHRESFFRLLHGSLGGGGGGSLGVSFPPGWSTTSQG